MENDYEWYHDKHIKRDRLIEVGNPGKRINEESYNNILKRYPHLIKFYDENNIKDIKRAMHYLDARGMGYTGFRQPSPDKILMMANHLHVPTSLVRYYLDYPLKKNIEMETDYTPDYVTLEPRKKAKSEKLKRQCSCKK